MAGRLTLTHTAGLTYLYGCTDYGDAVEDEWLVVYLLREISRTFSTLWIRIFDGDGEFLFVEAANAVPKWLSPSIDAHRAWVNQGKLQIIPLKSSTTEASKTNISLKDAIETIKTDSGSLIHSTLVEAEAFYRLEKYPGQISHSLHHSLVTLPKRAAYILHARPKAIAPAAEAFYLRNPVSLKPLLATSPEALKFPPADLVTISVRFTKVLFAQVKSQHFLPPPTWSAVLAPDAEAKGAEEQKALSRLEMGMKLTSGFEMLTATADESKNRLVREVGLLLQDLTEDGDQVLPSDEEIRSWADVDRDDDEAWLDINYEDLERELQGGPKRAAPGTGFGDASAAADLRKIVSRFESFLNDESAGLDGAEMDGEEDSDDEDTSDDDEDEDSGGEDKDVSFDEEEFARMMREMMGLPPGQRQESASGLAKESGGSKAPQKNEAETEDEAIQKLAAQMESELKGHGALSLDEAGKGPRALPAPDTEDSGGEDEKSGDEEVDLDYNLAKNLLESFKSQGGMSGPVGNMLGMMGMSLPRDEEETEELNDGEGKGKQRQQ